MEKGILILTQKIDKDDPILGFFHAWIERLSKEIPRITVICLEEGRNELPDNVRVFSLGKESGASRPTYIRRLFAFAWRERENYESVFVHMNQEYILLAGLMWKMLGKRIYMWRNHAQGNILTRIAVALSDRVYATSTHSFTAQFRKTRLMPAGIDTEFYRRKDGMKAMPHSVLCLGRISPVKRIDLLVAAADVLRTHDVDARISIVGDPTKDARAYYDSLREDSLELEREGVIRFFEAIPPSSAPELYNSHEIYVNLTNSGSFDKTIPEAMACERVVIISNRAFLRLIPAEYHEVIFFEDGDAEDLAKKIKNALALSASKRREIGKALREAVVLNQSLEKLVSKLVDDFNRS